MTDCTFEQWLATRPAAVQAVAAEHPIGSTYEMPNGIAHLVSYEECDDGSVMLGLSMISPFDDFDGAVASRFLVHPEHFEVPHD